MIRCHPVGRCDPPPARIASRPVTCRPTAASRGLGNGSAGALTKVPMSSELVASRPRLVRAGRMLVWFWILWNGVFCGMSIIAGLSGGSVALLSFGISQLVQVIAGGAVVWRLSRDDEGRYGLDPQSAWPPAWSPRRSPRWQPSSPCCSPGIS